MQQAVAHPVVPSAMPLRPLINLVQELVAALVQELVASLAQELVAALVQELVQEMAQEMAKEETNRLMAPNQVETKEPKSQRNHREQVPAREWLT